MTAFALVCSRCDTAANMYLRKQHAILECVSYRTTTQGKAAERVALRDTHFPFPRTLSNYSGRVLGEIVVVDVEWISLICRAVKLSKKTSCASMIE